MWFFQTQTEAQDFDETTLKTTMDKYVHVLQSMVASFLRHQILLTGAHVYFPPTFLIWPIFS